MEKRREYDDGEIIYCPKCESDDIKPLDPSSITPENGKCNSCGLEFTIKRVAVWKE